MEMLQFIRKGEDNPEGLPESDNIQAMAWEVSTEFPLTVYFANGTIYKYRTWNLVQDSPTSVWDALTQKEPFTSGGEILRPSEIFARYIKGKCPYYKIK